MINVPGSGCSPRLWAPMGADSKLSFHRKSWIENWCRVRARLESLAARGFEDFTLSCTIVNSAEQSNHKTHKHSYFSISGRAFPRCAVGTDIRCTLGSRSRPI